MQAVILANDFSYENVTQIKELYKEQGIREFIILNNAENEMIEEQEFQDHTVLTVNLKKSINTGGRLLKIANLLNKDEPFLLVYGIDLFGVELHKLLSFHKGHGRALSVIFNMQEDKAIFGGIMIVDIDALDYIDSLESFFERDTLKRIAEDEEVGWYFTEKNKVIKN